MSASANSNLQFRVKRNAFIHYFSTLPLFFPSALYEAQAKIAKAKASSYLARHPHGGNYNNAAPPQPSNQDDNVEYNQEQVNDS